MMDIMSSKHRDEWYSVQPSPTTRIVLYITHAQKQVYGRIMERSPNRDVFVILLYCAHRFQLTVLVDTCTGNSPHLLNILSNIEENLEENVCECTSSQENMQTVHST